MQAAKCWGNISCVFFGEVQHGEFQSGQNTNPGEVFERKVCNSFVEWFIFMKGVMWSYSIYVSDNAKVPC